MPINELYLFISVTLVVSASPGPMMLSCMAYGGRYGMKKAFTGMLGGSAGNLVLMLLSALGLGLLVSQNDTLFNLVKWAGAAYLVYLGWQIMRSPITHATDELNLAPATGQAIFISSFFIAISNPKGLIYFGALFPQFVDYQQPLFMQFFILTCIFLLTDLIWMFIYAAAGSSIMRWMNEPRHHYYFNIISGLVLMAAGILLAFSDKS
jgi:homoserine/homoserine lactone efflux protein